MFSNVSVCPQGDRSNGMGTPEGYLLLSRTPYPMDIRPGDLFKPLDHKYYLKIKFRTSRIVKSRLSLQFLRNNIATN